MWNLFEGWRINLLRLFLTIAVTIVVSWFTAYEVASVAADGVKKHFGDVLSARAEEATQQRNETLSRQGETLMLVRTLSEKTGIVSDSILHKIQR